MGDFARPHAPGGSFASFLESLPGILAVRSLRALVADVQRARTLGKPILWGLGAHVLKVGLSPVLLDLMERGLFTGLAFNGAGIVHDFELAVAGQTSEEVEEGLGSGAFGMAAETGEEVNRAIVEGDRDGLGLGAAIGRYLEQRRLPLHGLIKRFPRTHRYEVTQRGLRYALFFTRSYDRLLRPGLSLILPDQALADSTLRASFRQLEAAMTSWVHQAKLAS